VQLDSGFEPSLAKLVALLDRFAIRFHVTGGFASIAYGEPRLTQDIDLVLDHDRVVAVQDEFLSALAAAGFLFEEATARRAIAGRHGFQLIDIQPVIKLDLYVRELIPGELDRSVHSELFPGLTLPMVSRTDAALSKLIWASHGSHRSRRDVRRILAGATPEDAAAVRRGAVDRGLEGLLDEVLGEADELDL
jgi:hypothetical protein